MFDRSWQILLQKSWKRVRSANAQTTTQIRFLAARKSEKRFLKSRDSSSKFYPNAVHRMVGSLLNDFCNKIGTPLKSWAMQRSRLVTEALTPCRRCNHHACSRPWLGGGLGFE